MPRRRSWSGWGDYVPVEKRRDNARRELQALTKAGGRAPEPVVLDGKDIASTVWGKAWCEHIEGWRDYDTRLPRGRSYVRNGSVVDLEVRAGVVESRVAGSELYRVAVEVEALDGKRWQSLVDACASQVGSLVELLAGRISARVMAVLAHPTEGLLPTAREIAMRCSCPDHARMCKHVAATLYGVGARLDDKPELLFTLRQVDPSLLARAAGDTRALTTRTGGGRRLAAGTDLAALFGIELDEKTPAAASRERPARKRTTKK